MIVCSLVYIFCCNLSCFWRSDVLLSCLKLYSHHKAAKHISLVSIYTVHTLWQTPLFLATILFINKIIKLHTQEILRCQFRLSTDYNKYRILSYVLADYVIFDLMQHWRLSNHIDRPVFRNSWLPLV
jgi:hypothetical protein